MILIVAIGSTVVIISLGLVALLIANSLDNGNRNGNPTPPVIRSAIPVRVIDPLGGEDPDDLDDLIASWEVGEKELDASTLQEIKITEANAAPEEVELAEVSPAFLAEQQRIAKEPRANTGIRPAGLIVPPELSGSDRSIKQVRKLGEMIRRPVPYKQPMDFSDLAEKRLSKELIEMPMATKSYYLEVGGSASTDAFTAYSYKTGDTPILRGSEKSLPLEKLSTKFGLSLDNSADRKQIRTRLLRMFNPTAKPILLGLADAYYQQFKRPLRVTSLVRSIDYQIYLNKDNPNSYIVRGEGSLPPHTSGCAFDLARKFMSADEQNFVMNKLAELEKAQKLDALIEYGANACFHVFIYDDGRIPMGF